MRWQLSPGNRVRFREFGADRTDDVGRVRKTLHMLDTQLPSVPVYIVESAPDETLLLGDGEIIEKVSGNSPQLQWLRNGL